MIRCDNDECVLSRECWRFLIAPQDDDVIGVHRYTPKHTDEYNALIDGAALSSAERDRIQTTCDHFIELFPHPDNAEN